MSGGEQWRVLVRFRHRDEAETVLRKLRDLGDVGAAGGSLSLFEDKPAVLVYVPRAEAAGSVATAVRSGIDEIGAKPVRVSVDQWVPGELRWSGDPRRRPNPVSTGGLGIVDGSVFDLIFEIITGGLGL